jgi:hypothetical protein
MTTLDSPARSILPIFAALLVDSQPMLLQQEDRDAGYTKRCA